MFSLAFLMVLNTSVSLNNNKEKEPLSCALKISEEISLILERACIVIVYTSNDLCCRIMLLSFVFLNKKMAKNLASTWQE